MEYTEEWVMSRRNRYHGLAPLRKALEEIGHPEDHLRIVHVAGTNGKGSTVRFLCDILEAEGYRTGMFTSPHLICHRDRIRIGRSWIPQDVFAAYLREFEGIIRKYDLGMFEIDCLIAFAWFAKEKTDWAVMEAGMGGRLDNTNVIAKSELSVLTTIGKDHTNVLGERTGQIAFEKAGIIKEYGHCVTGVKDPSALQVIRHVSMRRHAALHTVRPVYSAGERILRYDGDLYEIASYAGYQKDNAALALEAARMLGIDIHSPAVHEAMKNSIWEGRFEILSRDPLCILDGAHNEEGIRALKESLKTLPRPRVIVFSALADKPYEKMLAMLEECCEAQIVTTFRDERAPSLSVYDPGRRTVVPQFEKAIEEARKLAGNGSVIITGSLHFISAVREYLLPL